MGQNDPKIIKVGNIIRGFSCTVKCDSPFAYGEDVEEYLRNSVVPTCKEIAEYYKVYKKVFI